MSNKDITLAEAVSFAVEAAKQRNLRPRYVKSVMGYLERFSEGRGNRPIRTITAQDIDEFLANRKPVTRKGIAGRLGNLFAYAVRKRFIQENPMAYIERVTVELGTPKILEVRQAASLLEFTRANCPRVLAYLTLCLFAGLRPAEAQRIIWANVNLEHGLIRVDPGSSKIRSRRRFVTILPATAAWLNISTREESLPLKQCTLTRWHAKASGHLGWANWSQDVLRHSAASYLLASSNDEGRVATQLGTSATMLRRHYVSLITPDQSAAFFAIRPRNDKQLEMNL